VLPLRLHIEVYTLNLLTDMAKSEITQARDAFATGSSVKSQLSKSKNYQWAKNESQLLSADHGSWEENVETYRDGDFRKRLQSEGGEVSYP
jgi:hypothetical protein